MNCFSGKLSCQFDEAESGKVYEREYVIVSYYEEIAHSFTGEPMKTSVVFSSFDLRVNNLLISKKDRIRNLFVIKGKNLKGEKTDLVLTDEEIDF
ncbi:hypothetical protein [Capnocytophaga felis]|nr:hypothetical protein [Capnocytophaga felis]